MGLLRLYAQPHCDVLHPSILVPAAPLSGVNGTTTHLLKPETPHALDTQGFGTRVNSQGPIQADENPVDAGDLPASLSRLPSG
jgi:hypothetical protein